MSPGGVPLNKGGPHIAKADPKAIMGPPVCSPDYYSEDQYAVSIMKIRRIRAYNHQRPQRNKDQYTVSRGLNTEYSRYGINIIFWKISNVVPTPRNPEYAVSNPLDTPY
ncbi:hypothetical protein Tco_0426214 [Tanacetum coccineum]